MISYSSAEVGWEGLCPLPLTGEYMKLSGDVSGCYNWVILPTSSGYKPGMLLNILQGIAQQRLTQTKIPTAPRLTNPSLKCFSYFSDNEMKA